VKGKRVQNPFTFYRSPFTDKQSNIMRKFTFLFATLLAMSGTVLGQKQGKVIWSKEIFSSGNYINWKVSQAPNKNILIFGSDYGINPRRYFIKSFDKDGKIPFNITNTLQDSTSYYFDQRYSNIAVSTPVYLPNPDSPTLMETKMDSAVFLNENFQIASKQAVRAYSVEEDGSIIMIDYSNNVKKIDKKNNLIWQYSPSASLRLSIGYGNGIQYYQVSNRPFVRDVDGEIILKLKNGYLFQYTTNDINNRGYIFLDKNGKEIAVKKSFTEPIAATNDGGLIVKHDGFQKLNSKGEELWSFRDDSKFFDPNGNTVSRNELLGILSDESLILQNRYSICENNVCTIYKSLIKINPEGKLVWQTEWFKNLNAQDLISLNDGGFVVFKKERALENQVINPLNDNEWSSITRFDKNGKVVWGQNQTARHTTAVRKIEVLQDNSLLVDLCNRVYDDNTGNWTQGYSAGKIMPDGIFEYYYATKERYPLFYRLSQGYVFTGYKNIKSEGNVYLDYFNNKGERVFSYVNNPQASYLHFSDIKEDFDGNILASDVSSYKRASEYYWLLSTRKFDKLGIVVNPLSSYTIPFSSNIIGNDSSPFYNIFPTDNGDYLATWGIKSSTNTFKLYLNKIRTCDSQLPTQTATASNTEACPTEKVKLSIPKQDGLTYQWQKDGKDLPNLTDAVYDIGESGTYTVVVKDASCQNQAVSNALKINIRSLPTAQIQAPKITFCEGDKTTITATTNGVFFQWRKDEKDIPNATSGILEVSQAGQYQVGVRDDKCPQVGLSNIIPITLKPSPEAKITTDIKTVIYEPFTVKMTANTGTGLSYQWLKDDVIIPNEISNIYEAKKSGKYNVSVTKDGCIKTSEALNISIQIALSAESEIGEEAVQIYPNPSRGAFKLILPKSLQNAEIQLFDLLGRERVLIYTGEQARADGLVQGTYFLRVSKGEKSVTNKIVVE
jgi:Secretion system C-terminal sorting domain